MANVTLSDVTKKFGEDVYAVNKMSLHIEHGKFLVLLGPSGCGKTTTLRLIAGLEQPDEGEILIGGKRVSHIPPQRRDVAVVFQSYALYPHMTVAGNMGFGLRMRGESKSEIDRKVHDTSCMLGIQGLLDRYPGQLSGGQRQRVALGRAIVRDPAVFLLDEPLSNLDAMLRAETRVELLKLQRRLNGTFVYVTHDQVEAMTLADVIAVMKDGVLQQLGGPGEIYSRPANTFVASFIGSPKMNLVEGNLVHDSAGIFLKTMSFDIRLPDRNLALLEESTGGKIVFGIRPEHIRVHSVDSNISAIILTSEVVEMLGSQQFIYGGVDGNRQQLTVEVDPKIKTRVGERIAISFSFDEMHFFHPETGIRIEVHKD